MANDSFNEPYRSIKDAPSAVHAWFMGAITDCFTKPGTLPLASLVEGSQERIASDLSPEGLAVRLAGFGHRLTIE